MAEIEVLATEPDLTVHEVFEDQVFASRGPELLERRRAGSAWRGLGTPPMSLAYRWASRFELPRRALRGGAHCVRATLDGGLVLVADRAIHRLDPDDSAGFHRVHELRRGRRPLPSGFTRTSDEALFYGEYWSNDDFEAVQIWRSQDHGRSWQVVHEFPAGEVRHVHAVQEGPEGKTLWVCTGDLDDESRILVSRDEGETFEVFAGGAQAYRAVSLGFRGDYVYWGTDDPTGENHLIRRDLESGHEKRLSTVKGPVYYSTRVGEHLLFSTAVEQGEGSQDGKARVYLVDPDDGVEPVAAFDKDAWHPILFGYGTIQFPHGGLDDGTRFWMTLTGLEGGHRSVLCELVT